MGQIKKLACPVCGKVRTVDMAKGNRPCNRCMPKRFEKTCKLCGCIFKSKKQTAIYCGDKCSSLDYQRTQVPRPGLRQKYIQGTIGEYKVTVDLLQRGYWVFRPMSFGCGFDLLALKDGKYIRIEVKTGHLNKKTGIPTFHHPKNGTHDVLAIVVPERIIYRPEEP